MAQFYSAKRRVTTRQIITVTVNDLDPFGQGVTRHQGKALFVGGVLPQEQAEVVLVEDKKQYARAQVKRKGDDKFITTDYLQQCPAICQLKSMLIA